MTRARFSIPGIESGETVDHSVMVGLDEFERALHGFVGDTQQAGGGALYTEASEIISDAQQITPVDTGALRSSAFVKLPEFSGGQVVVEMGFGGAAAEYALIVHEDPEAHHPTGQYKYLETPFNQHLNGLDERLAANVRSRMGA